MSAYVNFTACAFGVSEQYRSFIENNRGSTVGDFFSNDFYVDLVNELVVTYHNEVLATCENNFLTPERVPAGIVSLAKKRGVEFPRGFSIKKDERAYDIFLLRINDYREARGLTKKRVKEIRDQNQQKRVRTSE